MAATQPRSITGWSVLEAEQAEFVALVSGLKPAEWEAPSLCAGWTVRDVVIHAAAHIHGKQRDKTVLAQYRRGTNEDLVAWLASPATEARIPFTRFKAFDAQVQLGELLIHQQDIRRPLGHGRTIPEERLLAVLHFTFRRLGSLALAFSRKRAKGLHLVATDLGWTFGSGPDVRGPAEAILLATSGRTQALTDLMGSGVPVLAERA